MTNETARDGMVPAYRAPEREIDLVGTVVGGRYRIRRKLGEGGMGAVYAAEQEPLGREVALKIVRGDLVMNARTVERFRREAMTLSQLVHPHVVALYDFGQAEEGTLYFAMELLPGESLRARLQSRGRMGPDETVPIVREMCSALGAAHALGVLHRDLKPDNVMLIEAFGRKDFVKLLDFGIAKAVSGEGDLREAQSLTQSGTIVGTPGYVPREVAVDGVHDDPRSDLYALGVTWFEMLTGRAPFAAQTAVGLIMLHANEPAPRVDALVPEVPHAMASLVAELLAKQPNARPASADAVLARLDALAGIVRTESFVALPAATERARGTAPFLDAIPRTRPTSVEHLASPHTREVSAPRHTSRLLAAALLALAIAIVVFAFARGFARPGAPAALPAPLAPVLPAPQEPALLDVEPRVEPPSIAPHVKTKRPKPKLLEEREKPKLID